MLVLGIVGSPRRERGLSHQVVTKVLSGAQAAGAETQILYLIDQEPGYCIDCGHDCFSGGDCAHEEQATLRSQTLVAADALVVCAPVYCMRVNGLTAAFFDKGRPVRMFGDNYWNGALDRGRPALGIAVAGGGGGGVFAALQSIYAWLFVWGYRPLEPLAVTRYNLARVLDGAGALGETLAQRAGQPFEGVWWDKSLTYDELPYLHFGRVDETRWLAEQVIEGLKARAADRTRVDEIERLLERGRACAAKGDRRGAAQSYWQAFRTGYLAWQRIELG